MLRLKIFQYTINIYLRSINIEFKDKKIQDSWIKVSTKIRTFKSKIRKKRPYNSSIKALHKVSDGSTTADDHLEAVSALANLQERALFFLSKVE